MALSWPVSFLWVTLQIRIASGTCKNIRTYKSVLFQVFAEVCATSYTSKWSLPWWCIAHPSQEWFTKKTLQFSLLLSHLGKTVTTSGINRCNFSRCLRQFGLSYESCSVCCIHSYFRFHVDAKPSINRNILFISTNQPCACVFCSTYQLKSFSTCLITECFNAMFSKSCFFCKTCLNGRAS